jgi:hypothetical protein
MMSYILLATQATNQDQQQQKTQTRSYEEVVGGKRHMQQNFFINFWGGVAGKKLP